MMSGVDGGGRRSRDDGNGVIMREGGGRSIESRRREISRRLKEISERQKMRRMKSAMRRRHHMVASAEIERISNLLAIPDRIKEESLLIYQEAWNHDLIHGRSIERMVAASVYAACRKHNVPRTLEELEKATKVARKDIMRACKILAGRLSLRLPPVSPLEYVSRFCEKLNLREKVREKAEEIVRAALERNITSGRGPTSIAASAVYIAAMLCGDRQTQKAVAEAAGVTEVTLRVRYKELAKKLQINV